MLLVRTHITALLLHNTVYVMNVVERVSIGIKKQNIYIYIIITSS